MKILLITDSLIRGGKERRLIEFLNIASRRQDLSIILVLLKELIQYREIHAMTNVRLHILHRRIRKDPFVFARLFKIVKESEPDIIHSWGSMPSVYALPPVFFFRPAFVNAMISNAINPPWSKHWIRAKITFPFSDRIVSNSLAGLMAFKVPQHRGRVIHNGFNFDRLAGLQDPAEIRQSLGIKTKFLVGKVAAFHPRKDYTTYITAALSVLEKRNDVSFLSVGDGCNLGKYREMIPGRFADRFLFLGNQENVESIINAFDIGVLATNDRVHKEGISNAIMEYMAFGKPVIATRGGGTGEIVEDSRTGILIDPGSCDQLAGSIGHLLDNPETAAEMGRLGKQRIREQFSIEKMVDQTLAMYTDLVKPDHNQV